MFDTSKAQQWIDELKAQAKKGVIIALAGNKLDLVEAGLADKAVTAEEGRSFAAQNNVIFFETSAKTVSAMYKSLAFLYAYNSHGQMQWLVLNMWRG